MGYSLGRKIIPEDYQWLMGPFGNLNSINEDFINQFAEKENLVIDTKPKGLIFSINQLNISDNELPRLSEKVIDFYENTADYDLSFSIQWNSFFKVFGILINQLFSHRINQLNIPTHNIQNPVFINSEIITLRDPVTHETKYTFGLGQLRQMVNLFIRVPMEYVHYHQESHVLKLYSHYQTEMQRLLWFLK